jgi:peptidoglycan/LPS O-acetylase OafA/YrhL
MARGQHPLHRTLVSWLSRARQGAAAVSTASPSYRPDIDGLRAIAVLSVIGFHVAHHILPGGFLGVDIFFVISGYLITSILWRQVGQGRFSIAGFYDRRVRRIMPALLVLLGFSTIVALAILLPADLIGYSKSLLATLLFVANIYFWRDTDYFARAAEDKPLLHTWSLGVEEQFYIFFPLLLYLLRKLPNRAVMAVLAGIAAVSFVGNAGALYIGGDSPAFFLLPTRAWELSFGAVLALLPYSDRPARRRAETVLGLLGLVLILIALVHPQLPLTAFPVATPAVVGATLIIWAGMGRTCAATRLLALRPLVFVGLISYSLYLWHWPIIVFAQYYLIRELTWQEDLLLISLMIAVAAASWRFIEQPFRGKAMPIVRVRAFAVSAGLALCAVSALTLAMAGFPQRLSATAATVNEAVGTNYRCGFKDWLTLGRSRACAVNLPSRDPRDADTVLLGNSHMQMYAPVWRRILAERRLNGLLVPVNGCLPTVVANISTTCIAVARRNLAEVLNLPRVTTIVLGFNWGLGDDGLVDANGRLLDNRQNQALIMALDDLLARIQQSHRQVVLIGPIAEPGWDVASVLSRQLAYGRRLDRPTYLKESVFAAHFAPALDHFAGELGHAFARPDSVQCADGVCRYLIGGRSLFADSTHLAEAELERFRTIFEQALPPPGRAPAS